MDPFQAYPFPPPLSLVLLVLVATFVSILVTFFTTKQHYQNSTSTYTTSQAPKNTTPEPISEPSASRLTHEPLPAGPLPILIPTGNAANTISPSPVVAWRNSFGANMLPPRTRTSLSSSVVGRKGSCARCSWSSSDGDNGSGSEGSVVGSVGSREMFFGNMGGSSEVVAGGAWGGGVVKGLGRRGEVRGRGER
ncbi:hypothetical protein B0T21DRAFT_351591 [Apiosordaria backusii]|uniref:Uncharacterized protein n=1 Tax=Apiosordaria backusii TaxID=314023 RepID=A0AA40AMX0_9PEZI|nr:hypothetical protein B0T21DRAFT_351591 [Apiosordaria backusii]